MSDKPICRAFNVAVLHIASHLCPMGYDVSENAPQSLEELRAHYEKTGRILIWNGASDRTIFADPEVNWAFRAWHDWCHLRHNLPFANDGEHKVYLAQWQHLKSLYPGHHLLPKWQAMLDIEVNGQIAYYERTGHFPEDQYAFMAEHLPKHPITNVHAHA